MADKKVVLKGITWNHSRGLVPMLATAQRFSELNSGIDIIWEKRSLQQFADFSIDQLADRYDLLVIDHPWAGFAARTNTILPLDNYLSKTFIEDQKENSVGASFESYCYEGHQWAMAIDAAMPVASIPFAPAAPVNPIGPCAPVAPVKPCRPCAPSTPFAPVRPVSPIGPCAPVNPTGPCGPVASR